MRIAFIGIGTMGSPMVENILKSGYEVNVYSRTKEKCDGVVEKGAQWAASIVDCVRDASFVVTMVGNPKDVEDVYFGQYGIIENVEEGTTLIDMTTSSPKLARRIYAAAQERNLFALDAPVSGGDIGAQKGTLAVMVGGDEAAFHKSLPILTCMGENIRYEGESGMGQHTKLANQIAVAGALAGVVEAMAYAERVGLDRQKMLDTIGTGAAGSWQLENNAPKMIENDFAPGFAIKHFIKDMKLADEESLDRNRALPVLEHVLEEFEGLAQTGRGDEGTQALIRAYREEEV